ncbi:MAG: histidinol dehydrogenase [Bacteroidales bacterium]|nr:histidinol dehydrogenase [Bacteroidales bacterium]
MTVYQYPTRAEWAEIIERPTIDNSQLRGLVSKLLDDIRQEGDQMVRQLEARFDHCELDDLRVSKEEFEEAAKSINDDLAYAIRQAAHNISLFHESQRSTSYRVETQPGVTCWQKAIPIDRVGLYVPGGTAPLFSTVLMLAIPAKIAGCQKIVLCTPPNAEGKVNPAILFAAQVAGVTEVYKCGGVQAIGAMAFGTETVPKVYKIFGPGNQFVQMAKQLVSLRDVAIDMPAGPSEVAVIADASANLEFVASDFLSQAEHGADSQSVLFTDSEEVVKSFEEVMNQQLEKLSRQALTRHSLEHSKVVLLHDQKEIMELVNEYAPEHLIINTENYEDLADMVRNAGSVFLGPYSPESAGDYASGTNHTLPTNGYAKAYNGVNLDSYMRKVTFQHLTREGLSGLGPIIEVMAENEQLDAHKNAVTLRLQNMKNERLPFVQRLKESIKNTF